MSKYAKERKWEKAEETFLKKNYGIMTHKEIARRLDRSYYSIRNKCSVMKICTGNPPGTRQWPKEKMDDLKRLYAAGYPTPEIAAMMGKSTECIRSQVYVRGLKRPPKETITENDLTRLQGAL